MIGEITYQKYVNKLNLKRQDHLKIHRKAFNNKNNNTNLQCHCHFISRVESSSVICQYLSPLKEVPVALNWIFVLVDLPTQVTLSVSYFFYYIYYIKLSYWGLVISWNVLCILIIDSKLYHKLIFFTLLHILCLYIVMKIWPVLK